MDADTGQILFNKGMDDQRFPASITKIMTALLAIEDSTPDQQVTFTATGMADAYSGVSNINPQLGESFTMEQCLYMMMLKSANDVATQVAETIAGSVPAFVDAPIHILIMPMGCRMTIIIHRHVIWRLSPEKHLKMRHFVRL
jgi:D-alanyl-D-alanine carboxypeptidase